VLIKSGEKIILEFIRTGDLYIKHGVKINFIYDCSNFNYLNKFSNKDQIKDWNVILGHPSDVYLNKFLEINNISSNNQNSSRNCEICKAVNLKKTPHKNPLRMAPRPFHTLHIDLLQINPPSKTNIQYVLVIIDDYLRYNRIFLLRRKLDASDCILSFINEIKNKIDQYPAFIHTDRGGEFNSHNFLSIIKRLGINMEMGPANNPQTNGLAERFTILLSKMRLSLLQPRVLISLCNEAALYSSMLINILPSKALAWHTPMDILNQQKIYIEPTRNINRLVPFALQCHFHSKNTSKLHPTTKPLLCLGYEPFTDGL